MNFAVWLEPVHYFSTLNYYNTLLCITYSFQTSIVIVLLLTFIRWFAYYNTHPLGNPDYMNTSIADAYQVMTISVS